MTAVRNLTGLSLAKIASFYLGNPFCVAAWTVSKENERPRLEGVKFNKEYLSQLLHYMKSTAKLEKVLLIGEKPEPLLEDLRSKVELVKLLDTLFRGSSFLIRNIENEVFSYNEDKLVFKRFAKLETPALLVHIGDDLQIFKVSGEGSVEHLASGDGGNAILNLISLFKSPKSQNDAWKILQELSDKDTKDSWTNWNIFNTGVLSDNEKLRVVLANFWSQVGNLIHVASQAHKITKVIITQNFFVDFKVFSDVISESIRLRSKGALVPKFLRHGDFSAPFGSLIAEGLSTDSVSWAENFARSSGYQSMLKFTLGDVPVDQFVLQGGDTLLYPCPLVRDMDDYVPNSFPMHLIEHRLPAITRAQEGVRRVTGRTEEESKPIEASKKVLLNRLESLKHNPMEFGEISFPTIPVVIGHYTEIHQTGDLMKKIKDDENLKAVEKLKERLDLVDSLEEKDKHLEIVKGILAGNLFDWGAPQLHKFLSDPTFDAEKVKLSLQERPWETDDFNLWLDRLKGPCHKKAAIFVDNCGQDIVLGVIPFIRELLSRGTKVVICVNSAPALNDVTPQEMDDVLRMVREICPIIKSGLEENRLFVLESGQTTPCLDLYRLPKKLADEMADVDLIVIEGMGRGLVTNSNAQFTCESIKIAVLKDAEVDQKIEEKRLSCYFKYSRPT